MSKDNTNPFLRNIGSIGNGSFQVSPMASQFTVMKDNPSIMLGQATSHLLRISNKNSFLFGGNDQILEHYNISPLQSGFSQLGAKDSLYYLDSAAKTRN